MVRVYIKMDVIDYYLSDNQFSLSEMEAINQWAWDHCACYHGFKIIDVSDVSLTSDYVYELHFTNQQDLTLFKLVWL